MRGNYECKIVVEPVIFTRAQELLHDYKHGINLPMLIKKYGIPCGEIINIVYENTVKRRLDNANYISYDNNRFFDNSRYGTNSSK